MKKKILYLLVLVALILSACAQSTTTPASTSSAPRTLIVMTHDSFSASQSVIDEFQQANNVKLQFIASGDAGTALNKAILSKGNPFADVFYGVDNTFLSRALNEDIFIPYNSHVLAVIPNQYKLDPQNRALPVDWGDVCVDYDKAYFAKQNLLPPQNLEELAKPEYKNMLVVENPATSSPGMAFLLATIGHFGSAGYLNYWKSLVANNVLVENDWNTAFYTDFSQSGGNRPIVVSYNSDPAFEVINSSTQGAEPQIGVIASDGACFQQIEFVGILQGTKNLDLAQKWVDFMLSPTFQEDMPTQMYVFPVNPNAKLNATFQKYLVIPQNPAYMSPADIAANREAWINAWTQTVLK
jgi:thiamine transport system substrate-binding protein